MIKTSRDDELLEALGRYGILSTTQVKRLFFENADLTVVRRRLRKLEKGDFIRRVEGLDHGALGWCLTAKLARKVGIESQAAYFNRNSVHHEILLSELRLSLESVGVGEKWVPEHVLRIHAWKNRLRINSDKENISDGICTVVYEGKEKQIAIELELSLKNKSRYEKVLKSYRRRDDLWAVWYFAANDGIKNTIIKTWQEVNHGTRNDKLFVSLLPQAISTPWDLEIYCSSQTLLVRDIIEMNKPAALPSALSKSTQTLLKASDKELLAA